MRFTPKICGAVGAVAMLVSMLVAFGIGNFSDYDSNLNETVRRILGVWLYPMSLFWRAVLTAIGYKPADPYGVPSFIIASWFIYSTAVGFIAGWGIRRLTIKHRKEPIQLLRPTEQAKSGGGELGGQR